MRTVLFILSLFLALGGFAPHASAQNESDSTYTVQAGDTLYSIARDVGVSVKTLMRWNNLENTRLRVGQTLRIRPPGTDPDESSPRAPEPPAPSEQSQKQADTTAQTDTSTAPPPFGQYRTRSGDTFVSLALRLGTTADSLFALNDSTTTALDPGQTIRVPRRFGPPTHLVTEGETLYSIAGEYGVSVRALKVENDLKSNSLTPGQRLRVPGRMAPAPRSGENWAPPDTTGRVTVYPESFGGRLTASGATYDPDALVVSHPTLPFNSVVLLSSQETSTPTFARVIDRGPVEEDVLLDVSRAVAEALGLRNANSPAVDLRVVWIARAPR